MKKLFQYYTSSIGSKHFMAITGQLVCLFIVVHLAGNLSIFAGKETFNGYAHFLESKPFLVYPAEVLLVMIFLLHFITALKLTIGNWKARPVRYIASRGIEPKYFASSSMIYTALLLLIFIILHLIGFKFSERGPDGLYGIVVQTFSDPVYVTFYVFCMIVLGIHLFHGFQSSFLTLGFDHPKYFPYIQKLGYLYAIAMAGGFASIPLYFYFTQGGIK